MLAATGATVDEVKIWFPTTPEEIVKRVEAAICPQTKLAVLDHITSNTAIVLPMKQLVDMLNKRYSTTALLLLYVMRASLILRIIVASWYLLMVHMHWDHYH
jgi:isopenicillin-N epimerase